MVGLIHNSVKELAPSAELHHEVDLRSTRRWFNGSSRGLVEGKCSEIYG